MAEDVIIEGIGNNLKDWADEETLTNVYNTLKDMAKSMGKVTVDIAKVKGGLLKASADMFGSLKSGESTAESDNKERKKEVTLLQKFTKTLGKFVRHAPIIGNTLAYMIETTDTFGKILTNVGSLLIAVATTQIISQLKSARKMYEYGVTLQSDYASGLAVAAIAADNMRMTVGDLGDFAVKYAATMRMFDIVAFSREARHMSVYLRDFGVTTLETTELMADYLETQRYLGFVAKLTNVTESKNRKFAMEETVKWARALGTSREEIQKGASAVMRDTTAAAFFRDIQDASVKKHADSLMKSLVGIEGGKDAAAAMMNLIASEVPQANKMIIDLRKQGMNAAADIMMQMASTVRNGQNANHMLDELSVALSEVDIARLKQSLDDSATSVLALSVTMAMHRDMLSKLTPDEREARSQQIQDAVDLTNAWATLTSAFSQGVASVFQGSMMMAAFKAITEDVTEVIEDNKKVLQAFARNIAALATGILWLTFKVAWMINAIIDLGTAVGINETIWRNVTAIMLGLYVITKVVKLFKFLAASIPKVTSAIGVSMGVNATERAAARLANSQGNLPFGAGKPMGRSGGKSLGNMGKIAGSAGLLARLGTFLLTPPGLALMAVVATAIGAGLLYNWLKSDTTEAGGDKTKNVAHGKQIKSISENFKKIASTETAIASMAVSMQTIDQHASSLARLGEAISRDRGNAGQILVASVESNKKIEKDSREMINTLHELASITAESNTLLRGINMSTRGTVVAIGKDPQRV